MTVSSNRIAEIPENQRFEFDVFNDSRISSNVHEDLTFLHNEAPEIFYTSHYNGHWVATGFDVIKAITEDYEHFSVKEMQIPRIENPPVFIPLSLDPPINLPFRQALVPLFAPRPVKAMEEKIRHWAGKIIDDVAKQGSCDFMNDISILFPLSIFMELMGMPMDRLREFRALSEEFFDSREEAKIHELSNQIIGIMTEVIEQKKKEPDDGIISYLLNVNIGDRKITMEEIQNMCFLLFLGGMDTVANNTAFSFRHLAQDAELQQRLSQNPELIPNFVEESLRCFGVICNPRIVSHDFEKFGIKFKEGEMMLCMLPISGRDPRKNDSPNTFDIDRKNRQFLTFSSGPHLCVGAFLARAEIRILTEEWLKRIPSFSLKGEVDQSFRMGLGLALGELPLVW